MPLATPASGDSQSRGTATVWIGVVIAIVFPSIVTWVYFFQAAAARAGRPTGRHGNVLSCCSSPSPWRGLGSCSASELAGSGPACRGVGPGLLFGLAAAVAGWIVFRYVLSGSPMFVAAMSQIREKVAGFGIGSPTKFVALGAFYSLAHSLLEEYYWRWFVFGQLRRLVPLWPAIVISSLGLHGPPRARALALLRLVDLADGAVLLRSGGRRRVLGLALRPHRLACRPVAKPFGWSTREFFSSASNCCVDRLAGTGQLCRQIFHSILC